ncbi:MAG: hypothetical protein ISR48_01280 [Alphaproteobacteria bacterium]|nr:hypothetical protein [Alphaproteobacteria bacterium]
MTRIHLLKTNFTAGEINPELLGRGDLRAYENGSALLRNVFIHPTGGVTRRSGLSYMDQAPGTGRLVAFEFNTEQVYLLVFSDLQMDVYRDGVKVATIATPWTEAQIPLIYWTQSADTLLVLHPDVSPRKITRTSDTAWTIAEWSFVEEDNAVRRPFNKFADEDITLQASATTGTVTLTASADVFVSTHVGDRFRLEKKQVEITVVTSATQATATVKETLVGTSATKDWDEQAFSSTHGWPVSAAFHQDRLVIGGARDLPNRLWMSKSSDLYNFDLAAGLDDEAIDFDILSDQVNAIRAVFSGRHLQIFTSGAEWMVTGDPLTPSSVQLKRQTRIGSSVTRNVPPRDVDGATVFVTRNGREVREFLFTDVEQAYQSSDLSLLARHLVTAPLDQDFDQVKRLLHLVMNDGTLGTLTLFRAEQVTAWTLQETDGTFLSVAVVGDDVYALIQRTGGVYIEKFDDNLYLDSALAGTSGTPVATWSGLSHLEGETVKILADGSAHADKQVSGGAVTLDVTASEVQIGLGFTHKIEPLPPSVKTAKGVGQGMAVRLIEAVFRLIESRSLRVDTGKGFSDIPFKSLGDQDVLDAAPPLFTGDKKIRAMGWRRDGVTPLWRISQDTPLPSTILSVTTEIKVND